MNAIESIKAWWKAAPEWQRRLVIGLVAAISGFLAGLVA